MSEFNAAKIEILSEIPKIRLYQPRVLKALLPKKPAKLSSIALPSEKLRVENVSLNAKHLKEFKTLCGFDKTSNDIPLCYPHVISFGLHMQLLTSESFPFKLLGTVHIENNIERFSRMSLEKSYNAETYFDNLTPHHKGASYDIVTEYRNAENNELVWREHFKNLVMLPSKFRDLDVAENMDTGKIVASRPKIPCSERAEVWKLRSQLGRQYGAVSGDRNPIHLYPLTAKIFGFKRHIIHGMWTLSRSNASADALLRANDWNPERLSLSNRFFRPIFLPGTVHHYATLDTETGKGNLEVWNSKADMLHMQAEIQSL